MRFPTFALLLLLCTCVSAQKNGAPGPGSVIKIRCSSAVSPEPLIVVDGYPFENGNLNDLDPNSIEAISIIKDASATALYGARGANGVVIITTKSGNFVRPNYTLTSEEIPADIFTRYAELNFGAGKKVIYLLDGKPRRLKKLRKLDTTTIEAIKVYEGTDKAKRMGHSHHERVVDVTLR